MKEGRWECWIDVGGTFTDCIGRDPGGKLRFHKTLSSGFVFGITQSGSTWDQIQDSTRHETTGHVWRGYTCHFHGIPHPFEVIASGPGWLRLRPHEGTSDIYLQKAIPAGTRYQLSTGEPAPILAMRYLLKLDGRTPLPPIDLRLGTTKGTNALLTRTGAHTGLVTTRGFGDFLHIGYQTRPDLFALHIRKQLPLFAQVVEIAERISARGEVLIPCDREQVIDALESIRKCHIDALAICLLHANVNPTHECFVSQIARELGFREISISHQVSSLRKFVARGDTTVLDAYLNPVLREYLHQIQRSLDPRSTLSLMTSSGGLASVERFRGRDSVFSGPAGGVIGVARAAASFGESTAIGFDMGGTSTDVARWSGQLEFDFESEKGGVRIATPVLAIETVAAGGGSICRFDGVKLCVGPASAGADPGPACYGRGGPLTITDVNLYLGRIVADRFPFPLDLEVVERLLEEHCREIADISSTRFTRQTLAEGYLRVANATMAEAIRSVTIARGYDPRNEMLVAFGGAAPQHACAVAAELGISRIMIHPFAGILSAWGIGTADMTVHREQGVYRPLEQFLDELEACFESLKESAMTELSDEIADKEQVEFIESLDLRLHGVDAYINVRRPIAGSFADSYAELYTRRFGHLPGSSNLEVVTARVSARLCTTSADTEHSIQPPSRLASDPSTVFRCEPDASSPRPSRQSHGMHSDMTSSIPVFSRQDLERGTRVVGPALVHDLLSTLVIESEWEGRIADQGEILLVPTNRESRETEDRVQLFGNQSTIADSNDVTVQRQLDPVLLEVFNRRFVAIAEQMGTALRQNARSVNVKERLDFSCALFTNHGDLVVNAPHIPVHLGAMGETVRHILQTIPLTAGDVIITNDPFHGGSHLPDVTVVTPVFGPEKELRFLTASRAHHAEIGGVAPGSMSPTSRNLAEEGVLIRAQKIVSAGEPQWDQLRHTLLSAPFPSRDVELNLADVLAQIAANQYGVAQLQSLVDQQGWDMVRTYMQFMQDAAATKTRRALLRISDGDYSYTDYLDDGCPISVTWRIRGDRACIDFTGSGPVASSNLNANRAIVTAAVMYVLRMFIDEDIPLNEGVLSPVDIVVPVGILSPPCHPNPGDCAAVAGGNVETSQRIVDVLLGAMGIAAASQGTMNNVLIGDDRFGYYETICGGAGATPGGPGADAVQVHMTNTRMTDPEVLEQRYPLRLHEFSIRRGSGGRGKHRGGDGVVRKIEFLRPLTLSLVTQRRGPYMPYGICGGQSGALGENWILKPGEVLHRLPASTVIRVNAHDQLWIKTPGGGGYGDPPENH